MTEVDTARRPRRRPVAFLVVLLMGAWLAGVPAAASAHDDEEIDQASVLVLQAIGFIVNKPGDMDDITDKIDDALDAPEKDGVDMAKVQAAKEALDKEDMETARAQLQESLASVPMESATGEETGTTVVHDALDTRGDVDLVDWVLLVLSALILALGAWLSVRFRPAESVRGLRRLLASKPRSPSRAPEEMR